MTRTADEKKKKTRLMGIIIVLLLMVIGLLIFLLPRPGGGARSPRNTPPMRDANAAIGQYEGKTDEEIQAELNRIVEEGMFNISINPEIVMESGSADAELRIENVPGNQHLMSVEITLDDTGEVIYKSGLIEPNYHIQSAPLDKTLAAGIYAAAATFYAHDADTEEVIGTAGAIINITIKN